MIDVLPFGFAMYKVQFPHSIIYTFRLTGLFFFVWADEFDRKHGIYESNRRSVIMRCDSLRIDDRQREPARITEERYLSINGRGLGQILQFHAATKPDNSFGTEDLKLFFAQSTNGFNDAERLLENFVGQAAILRPEMRRSHHHPRND